MRSFKEEMDAIKHELETKNHIRRLDALVEGLRKTGCVIYGAGKLGHVLYDLIQAQAHTHECGVAAFCDTYKRGTDLATGLSIISPEELVADYSGNTVVIGTFNYDRYNLNGVEKQVGNFDDICTKLQEINYRGRVIKPEELLLPFMMYQLVKDTDLLSHIEKYEYLWNCLEDEDSRKVLRQRIRYLLLWEPMTKSPPSKMYFEPDIFPLSDDEVFVDAGFFIGDTTEAFIRNTRNRFKHIYGFEANENSLAYCIVPPNEKITIERMGLWSKKDVLRFNYENDVPTASAITPTGSTSVPVTSIDDYFADKKHVPTYIKMDIEGAEKEALLGAKNIITKYKPKLAICVYHKLEDMYELPLIIKEYNRDYKFFLKHYCDIQYETILYAY